MQLYIQIFGILLKEDQERVHLGLQVLLQVSPVMLCVWVLN